MSALPFEPGDVFRAIVEPIYRELPQRVVFIESSTEEGARHRIASALAGLEAREVSQVLERVSQAKSGRRCIEEGQHEDEALRLFEISQTTAGPVLAEHPMFLLLTPGKFGRLWAKAIGLTPATTITPAPTDSALGRLAGEAFTRVLLSTGESDLAVTARLGGRLIEELRRRGFTVVRSGGATS